MCSYLHLCSLFHEYNWHRFLFLDDTTSFEWIEPHYCSSLFAALNNMVLTRNNVTAHIDLVQHEFEMNRDVFELLRSHYAGK